MKDLYKDLQKSHMKKIKSETKLQREDISNTRPPGKGFIRECLVRVELEDKWEESCRDTLKVGWTLTLESCPS